MNFSLPKTYRALAAKEDNLPPRIVELPLEKPGKNQVLVKVAFAPMNRTSQWVMEGGYRLSYQSPYLVGQECSGIVAAIGVDLKRTFQVGDRVHVHVMGSIAEYVLVDSEDCALVKQDLSLEDATAHIINPTTVAYMVALAERGGHKAVISTAASSAIGKMLIRYLKQKGIKSINIVRQDKHIDELKREGADYVLNSESPDFEAQLKEIATREEAKIAFDSINADITKKILDNMPSNSTCYVYGGLSGGYKWNILETYKFDDGKTITGLLYRSYIQEFKEKGEIDKLYDEVHSRLKTIFRVDTHKVVPFDEVFEAAEYYKTHSTQGQILLKIN